METELLGSLRLEEESFMRSSFDDIRDMKIYVDNGNDRFDDRLRDESHEDYGRTLNDWQRHVVSFPTIDSDDLVGERLMKYGADIFEYNAPIEKPKDVCGTIKVEDDISILNINYGTLTNGDNRLIDNDNTIEESGVSRLIKNSVENNCILDSFHDDKLLRCESLSNIFDTSRDVGVGYVNSESNNLNEGSISRHDFNGNSKLFLEHISAVQRSSHATNIHRKYSMNSVKNKRKKQMSLSLPQSPEHDSFGIDSLDLQSSFCLEDIDSIDFNEFVDEDINISPEKAFNRNFDIVDVFNAGKDDILKKEIDSADNLFNSDDITDFDLPSYIIGKDEDSSEFLIDCFNTSQESNLKDNDSDMKNVRILDNCVTSNSSNEFEGATGYADKSFLISNENTTIKVNIVSDINPADDETIEEVGISFPVSNPYSPPERKEDTDDDIDVENVSDGEAIPVLAANSLNSLLEQFEASEDLSMPARNTNKSMLSKKSNYIQNNASVSEGPNVYMFPKVWKVDWDKQTTKSKCASGNVKVQKNASAVPTVKVEHERVFLEHDYCHVYPTRSEPRIFGKNSGLSSKSEHAQKPRDTGEFVDLSPYYKNTNAQSPEKYGIGKGKNMSMLISINEKKSSKNEGNSLLKPMSGNKVSILKGKRNLHTMAGKQNVTIGSEKISADNVYSHATTCKQDNLDTNKINAIDFKKNVLTLNDTLLKSSDKMEKKEMTNVQNVIVLENGKERLIDINKNSQNIVALNRSVPNKNSLLISNFKKQTDEKCIRTDISPKVKTSSRQKVSLLKPIKDNVKMVSVLKSNYSDEKDFKRKLEAKFQEEIAKPPLLKISNNKIHINSNKTSVIENIKTTEVAITNVQTNKILQKRKLNIEEYKKRREGSGNSCDSSRTCSPISVSNIEIDLNTASFPINSIISNEKNNISKKMLSMDNIEPEASISNQNTELDASNPKNLFDPIAEASKKALKMKKLSYRIKNEDKIIKSKIPDVQNLIILPLATENGKLLPMIKKVGDKPADPAPSLPIIQKDVDVYDEIVTVCFGTNTDESSFKNTNKHKNTQSSRNKNLISIDKNIIKKEPLTSVKSSDSNPQKLPTGTQKISLDSYVHGENITVMYLLKDRIKLEMCSVSTQTNSTDINVNSTIVPVPNEMEKVATQYIKEEKVESDKKVRRERRDSSMSISGDSVDNNYIELINRWKSDVKKKDVGSDISKNSSRSQSPISVKSDNRSKRHSSKYKSRKRRDSELSDISRYSAEYRRRSRSFSRNRRKNESSRDSFRYSKTYMKSKDNSDNRSIRSLPVSKRKRNSSMSSNDQKDRHRIRHRKKFQPPSKISKDYDDNWDNRSENNEYGFVKSYRRSRSLSGSSDTSRNDSDSDSDSSTSSRNSITSYSSGRSNSNGSRRYRNRSRSRNRSRRHSGSSRRWISSNYKKGEMNAERKIIYVGLLEPDITVSRLKMKFVKYGCVEEVKIRTKKNGTTYGFVTFAQAQQSYKALEGAMNDPDIKDYEVFFGGRRAFCMQNYADLDEIEAMHEESGYYPDLVIRSMGPPQSFENLLLETKAALSARQAKDKKAANV